MRKVTPLLPPLAGIMADAKMSPSAVTHIVRNTYISAAAAPLNVAICMIGLWGSCASTMLLAWGATTLLATLYVYRRSRNAIDKPAPKTLSARARRRTYYFAAFYAAPWAALPLFFLGSGAPAADAFILVLSAGNCAGGAFLLQRAPFAALCYFGTILAAVFIACFAHDPSLYGPLALYTLPFGAVLFMVTISGNRVAVESDRSLQRAAATLAELHKANEELNRLRAAAEREAERDALTGLLNRRGLTRALSRRGLDLDMPRGGIAVLHLDLDGFKQINDLMGHAAGDELLKRVAEGLHVECRNIDVVARIGGDEFAIVAERVATLGDVKIMADRILSRIRAPLMIHGRACRVSGSIGIDFLAPQSKSAFAFDAMLTNADKALYRAKESGKNRFEVFDASAPWTAPPETVLVPGDREPERV